MCQDRIFTGTCIVCETLMESHTGFIILAVLCCMCCVHTTHLKP